MEKFTLVISVTGTAEVEVRAKNLDEAMEMFNTLTDKEILDRTDNHCGNRLEQVVNELGGTLFQTYRQLEPVE
jgi:hypothetical protein